MGGDSFKKSMRKNLNKVCLEKNRMILYKNLDFQLVLEN